MKRLAILLIPAFAAASLVACGGGGNHGGQAPPQAAAQTYAVTLLAVDTDRSADQQDLPLAGLPADGATITVE